MSQQTFEQQSLSDIVHISKRSVSLRQQEIFVAFLSALGLVEYLKPLNFCATHYAKYRCSKNPNHSKRARYIYCGKRGICPICSMNYAFNRSAIMYQWIKQNLADKLPFDLKINHMVLTLPKELHTSINSKIFVKMIKKFMSEMNISAYGYCIQERHSKNPLGGRYVHVHILVLNIKQDKDSLTETDYYFDTEKMRNVWKNIIKKFTGFESEGAVNVHTEYASVLRKKNSVMNMLAYVYRYPIVDLFETVIKDQSAYYLDTMQFDPTSIASEIRSMAKTKPRLVWCGLLTSAKRELLMSLISINRSQWKDIPSIRKDLALRDKTCLDCGANLESRPYEIVFCGSNNELGSSVSSVLYCSQNFSMIGRRKN